MALIAEVEEELPAILLDALLGLGEVLDLEAEMMRADEGRALLEVGALLPAAPVKLSSARLMTPSLM